MIDKFKREIEYVRISVTDRCNFRCQYCMPLEGVEYMEHDEILSFEEILRVVECLAVLGVKKVKVTGGEPFVRKGLIDLLDAIKKIEGIQQVTVTTNGLLLANYTDELINIGIDGINVSLDTLNDKKFKALTRINGDLDEVIRGIDNLLDRGFKNIKLNMVPIKNVNEEEIDQMISFAKKRDIPLRFIELMPIGCGNDFEGIKPQSLKSQLEEKYGELKSFTKKIGNGPAEYFEVNGVKLGFISAVSDKFCNTCNRVRLTADGYLKTCLHYDYGINVRALLRMNSSSDEIISKMSDCIGAKPEKHVFHLKDVEHEENKKMYQIGG